MIHNEKFIFAKIYDPLGEKILNRNYMSAGELVVITFLQSDAPMLLENKEGAFITTSIVEGFYFENNSLIVITANTTYEFHFLN